MTDRITLQRFRALAQTYGANLDRWPDDERAAAMGLMRDRQAQDVLQQVLKQARQLDAALDLWPDEPVPDALVGRTVASLALANTRAMATTPVRQATSIPQMGPIPQRTPVGRRLWWVGVGLAAAISGLAAGSVAASTFLPDNADDIASTSFGDIPELEE